MKTISITVIALLLANIFAIPFAFALSYETDPADLNRDGQVNQTDLNILLRHWGPCIETNSAGHTLARSLPRECTGDINQDKTVDAVDLGLLLAAWSDETGNDYESNPDLNNDGAVDDKDLKILLAFWGPIKNKAFNSPDVNSDGTVNVADLTDVLASWGSCTATATHCNADINGDNRVDGSDIKLVEAFWGTQSKEFSINTPDLNNDGIVNSADLGILLSSWSSEEEPTFTNTERRRFFNHSNEDFDETRRKRFAMQERLNLDNSKEPNRISDIPALPAEDKLETVEEQKTMKLRHLYKEKLARLHEWFNNRFA